MTLVLIFGTSHVGKSTLAARVGTALDRPVISTDKLGRHPGRPWPRVPPAVEEHYDKLSDTAILWFLRVHHGNMRAMLVRRIEAALAEGSGLVLEGSALRPDLVAEVAGPAVRALGLIAPETFVRARIVAESGWAERDPAVQRRIDRFAVRSIADGDAIAAEAEKLGLPLVDVSDGAALEAAFGAVLEAVRGAGDAGGVG
ncbi:MAG: AAA family ATPase [Pseudomonadota bacterium]